MVTKLESVQEWIEDVRGQKAKRLELHSKLDAGLIRTWRLGDNDGEDTATIAGQIYRRAEREGQGVPVVRATFILFAFLDEGAVHCDRTTIIVDGSNAKGKSGEGVEEYDSSQTGLLTQLMRTNLDQTRLILNSQESRHVHAEQLIDRLQKDNVQLQSERIKVWSLLEQVQTMHLEREQLRNAMRLEEKRDEFIFEKLSMMLPVALNRVMGGGPGKGTPFFGEEMTRQLLGSLTPEQTDAMLKNQPLQLSESQLALIAELTLAYAEKEKQRERRKINVHATKVEDGASTTNGKEPPS